MVRIPKERVAPSADTTGTRRRRPPTGPRPAPLSRRQRQTYEFVIDFIAKNGLGPTRAEIAKGLGMKHKSNPDAHLSALALKNWVELRVNSPRFVRPLHDEVPVVFTGAIAAGEETVAYERIVDQVPRRVARWFNPCPDFFVELHDESMRGAGLVAGDLIAIHANQSSEITGKIVVVRTQGEIKVRRLQHVDERQLALVRETTGKTDIDQVVDLDESEIQIEGVMIGALIGPRPAPDEHREEAKTGDLVSE